MNDSAVWLTCRDCGDTTRVLALMASRVLETRTHCPECQSTCEPCLNLTPVGQGISFLAEQGDALRDMDDKELRDWLENEAHRAFLPKTALQWVQAAGNLLAERFARGGMSQRKTPAEGSEAYGRYSGRSPQGDRVFHGNGTIGETGSAAIRL